MQNIIKCPRAWFVFNGTTWRIFKKTIVISRSFLCPFSIYIRPRSGSSYYRLIVEIRGAILRPLHLCCYDNNISGSFSNYTTTFCNSYNQGKRKQIINQVANKIKTDQIPKQWNKIKIIHICPIANEVGEEIFGFFENTLVGLTPQGLMRRWDKGGQVYPKKWIPSPQTLSQVDILIFSEEDISDFPEVLEKYKSL